MAKAIQNPIRVMRVIARMNIGGPAVQVAELIRGLNPVEFNQRLYTGFCESNEADYVDTVATDLKVFRIDGFGFIFGHRIHGNIFGTFANIFTTFI